ncbi:hypothetical protein BC826DRAFT_1175122 [Russula brevipes]|nr:hypothetical protein BC826DRAFT_1175122 [Russula brevipes]
MTKLSLPLGVKGPWLCKYTLTLVMQLWPLSARRSALNVGYKVFGLHRWRNLSMKKHKIPYDKSDSELMRSKLAFMKLVKMGNKSKVYQASSLNVLYSWNIQCSTDSVTGMATTEVAMNHLRTGWRKWQRGSSGTVFGGNRNTRHDVAREYTSKRINEAICSENGEAETEDIDEAHLCGDDDDGEEIDDRILSSTQFTGALLRADKEHKGGNLSTEVEVSPQSHLPTVSDEWTGRGPTEPEAIRVPSGQQLQRVRDDGKLVHLGEITCGLKEQRRSITLTRFVVGRPFCKGRRERLTSGTR